MINARAIAACCVALLLSDVAAAQTSRRAVDSAGRQVELPVKIERVYAAGPPASLLVYAIAPDKLLGWTRAMRPDEAAFLPERYANLPELGRLTGRGNTANVEVVLRARPDVIVDAGSIAPTFASLADRVQTQTGIPYVLLDGRFDALPQALRTLGALMGDEARGNELARYVDATLRDIRSRIDAVPQDRRPRVYYGRGPAGLQTGLGGSINVEVLEFLGARNVAAKTNGGLANVSLEQVLTRNPEVIITNDPHFYASVWKDARWSGVAAVRAKRVALSPHLPFGWFDFPPGVNRLIGLRWAAQVLYPELFRDDLRKHTAEFYRLFYHREPTSAQLDALLGEAGVLPR